MRVDLAAWSKAEENEGWTPVLCPLQVRRAVWSRGRKGTSGCPGVWVRESLPHAIRVQLMVAPPHGAVCSQWPGHGSSVLGTQRGQAPGDVKASSGKNVLMAHGGRPKACHTRQLVQRPREPGLVW